jgi:hypothetical protein
MQTGPPGRPTASLQMRRRWSRRRRIPSVQLHQVLVGRVFLAQGLVGSSFLPLAVGLFVPPSEPTASTRSLALSRLPPVAVVSPLLFAAAEAAQHDGANDQEQDQRERDPEYRAVHHRHLPEAAADADGVGRWGRRAAGGCRPGRAWLGGRHGVRGNQVRDPAWMLHFKMSRWCERDRVSWAQCWTPEISRTG